MEEQVDGEGWGASPPDGGAPPGIIALSHLRWGFVHQRPQHLLSRAAATRRVFFVEEPVYDRGAAHLDERAMAPGVVACVPHLPIGISRGDEEVRVRILLRALVDRHELSRYVLWHETPMFVRHTDGLSPVASVYDCMDELAAFAWAPAEVRQREAELLSRVDLVFTGGQSLFERKRHLHRSVHAFPSSVDARHFASARSPIAEPPDQGSIPRPRLGYFGVVDERMDLELLEHVATERPNWHLVIIGPILKIDPHRLPARSNIHYLGLRSYDELPGYVAGWDVAMMPFARNEATRCISPTKTLEYLAAGRAVISTWVHDVVHPYGVEGVVSIAESPGAFLRAAEAALAADHAGRIARADAIIANTSWDRTWSAMDRLLDEAIRSRDGSTPSTAVPS
jgi:glycosyltransferase involved in cell wall biosynthesis